MDDDGEDSGQRRSLQQESLNTARTIVHEAPRDLGWMGVVYAKSRGARGDRHVESRESSFREQERVDSEISALEISDDVPVVVDRPGACEGRPGVSDDHEAWRGLSR